MTEDIEFIKTVASITALGFATVFLIVMKPLISAIAQRLKNKINGNNSYSLLNGRIKELEEWQREMEGNHFRDTERRLTNLENDTKELRKTVENILIRVAKIETHIGLNGKK